MRTAVWMAAETISDTISTRTWSIRAETKRTHVQTTGDAGTLQRLVGTVLLADGHETGHLNLGELDLSAAKGGQRLYGGIG